MHARKIGSPRRPPAIRDHLNRAEFVANHDRQRGKKNAPVLLGYGGTDGVDDLAGARVSDFH